MFKLFRKKKEEKKYSWSDITIAQYKKILALNSEDEDYAFELVAVFENTTLKEIYNRPIDQVLKCTQALNKFISAAPQRNKIKSKYKLGDTVYELSSNPADITTAQYFDFINTPKEIPQYLSNLLSVFMVPEGKKYNEEYDIQLAVRDIENNMKIEDAMGVCFFFRQLYQTFSDLMLRRTRKALRKMQKEMPDQKEQIQKLQKRVKNIQEYLDTV